MQIYALALKGNATSKKGDFMGGIIEFLKYSRARTIAKIILLLWAIAISTFSMTSSFLIGILRFDIGFEIRNWIVILGLPLLYIFIKESLIVPSTIPFLDKTISRYIYFISLILLAIAISSISFPLMDGFLNMSFFGYPLIAIRNFVSIILLLMIRIIHISA